MQSHESVLAAVDSAGRRDDLENVELILLETITVLHGLSSRGNDDSPSIKRRIERLERALGLVRRMQQ